MRISIIAVGRLKDDAEREIVARYLTRFQQAGKPLGLSFGDVIELPESRALTAELRKADEAKRMLRAADDGYRIALDVAGRPLSSAAFAAHLATQRDGGRKTAVILVGGPDGFDTSILSNADLSLTLGPMILPHGLARVVIAEQLYRAATILSGHPYHRA